MSDMSAIARLFDHPERTATMVDSKLAELAEISVRYRFVHSFARSA